MELNENERARRGIAVSIAGIVLNFALAAAKTALGLVCGLVSLVADGLNNLSDCGSGTVSLVSFRIAQKPADKEHPYGHQRAEYIASMIISFLILLFAVELLRESIGKIIAGERPVGNLGVYVLLGVSVFVKAGMFFLYRAAAKKTDSDMLRAAAIDSLCDCFATFAVGIGLVLCAFDLPADGYAALVVSLFIGWEGISILRDASSKLLGKAPDPALVERVCSLILAGEEVLGVHDLRLYLYGPNKLYATAHIQMRADLPASVTHERIDKIEREVLLQTGAELTVHFDPVDLNDEEGAQIEARIRAAIEGIYEGMDLHDFRIVRGEKIKVVFEAGIPFDCKAKDGEIEETLSRAVELMGYLPAVTVERE